MTDRETLPGSASLLLDRYRIHRRATAIDKFEWSTREEKRILLVFVTVLSQIFQPDDLIEDNAEITQQRGV